MLPTDPRLDLAESIALDRLVSIARDSESDHEARLAAAAIFAIRRPCAQAAALQTTAPTPTPPRPSTPSTTHAAASPPPRSAPLTPDELAQLALHLPSVRPQRFLNKHTPTYWRDVLDRHRAPAPASPRLAPTGPPAPTARAA